MRQRTPLPSLLPSPSPLSTPEWLVKQHAELISFAAALAREGDEDPETWLVRNTLEWVKSIIESKDATFGRALTPQQRLLYLCALAGSTALSDAFTNAAWQIEISFPGWAAETHGEGFRRNQRGRGTALKLAMQLASSPLLDMTKQEVEYWLAYESDEEQQQLLKMMANDARDALLLAVSMRAEAKVHSDVQRDGCEPTFLGVPRGLSHAGCREVRIAAGKHLGKMMELDTQMRAALQTEGDAKVVPLSKDELDKLADAPPTTSSRGALIALYRRFHKCKSELERTKEELDRILETAKRGDLFFSKNIFVLQEVIESHVKMLAGGASSTADTEPSSPAPAAAASPARAAASAAPSEPAPPAPASPQPAADASLSGPSHAAAAADADADAANTAAAAAASAEPIVRHADAARAHDSKLARVAELKAALAVAEAEAAASARELQAAAAALLASGAPQDATVVADARQRQRLHAELFSLRRQLKRFEKLRAESRSRCSRGVMVNCRSSRILHPPIPGFAAWLAAQADSPSGPPSPGLPPPAPVEHEEDGSSDSGGSQEGDDDSAEEDAEEAPLPVPEAAPPLALMQARGNAEWAAAGHGASGYYDHDAPPAGAGAVRQPLDYGSF